MKLIRLVCGLVPALLAACSPLPRAEAPAAPPQELKVIVFPGGFNWPLWAAQAQGFFVRNGVDVKTVNTPNSTFQLTGLVKGDFEIAMTAVDNLIAYREGQGAPGVDGADLVAVMGGDSGFLKLVAQPDIGTIAQLRGKEVSVDSLTTGYAFVLLEILARNGLVLDRDYKTVPAGGVMQRFEQLLAGRHAATMLISPFDVLAQAQGKRVLADASATLGSYQGLVAGVRRSWAQQNAGAVTGYIRGYREALDWLYEPRNRQAALDLFLRNVPNSTPQSASQAYDILLHPATGFERQARLNEAGVRTVVELRERYGKPSKKMQPVSAYYEPRYYQAARR
ncbi:MAG TPA: ABC transporter substrate-binding protein [Caldimonas sp.]|nr:ABC transporter substrate-binding protein [Caldimonas sp.]HEX2539700.1 ABC transporter substrate-binding protein [Caldimonas sp.]